MRIIFFFNLIRPNCFHFDSICEKYIFRSIRPLERRGQRGNAPQAKSMGPSREKKLILSYSASLKSLFASSYTYIFPTLRPSGQNYLLSKNSIRIKVSKYQK